MNNRTHITQLARAYCVQSDIHKRKTVVSWCYQDTAVPAVSQLALTLVEFGLDYYCHMKFSPETLKRRKDYWLKGHFRDESMNLDVPPVHIASAPLLSKLLPALGARLGVDTPLRDTLVLLGY